MSCLFLYGLIRLAVPGRDAFRGDIESNYWMAGVLGVVWTIFTAIVVVHVRRSYAILLVSDAGVARRIFGRQTIVRWEDVGRLVLRSRNPSQKLEGLALNIALQGAAVGVGSPVTVHVHGRDADPKALNAFEAGSLMRMGRVPMGKILGRRGQRLLSLGEGYDWDLFDDLVANALRKGVVIDADGVKSGLVKPDERGGK